VPIGDTLKGWRGGMKPEDLITCCGLYGGCCARYKGHPALRAMAALLAELADAQGFQDWMIEETQEFDYAEFRKGLAFFAREDTWLVCENCCKGGAGGPPRCLQRNCYIRACCRDRGVDVCFECSEFPCKEARDDAALMKRGEEYKRLGRQEWLRRMAEATRKGYEFHTRKYYKVRASEDPPDDE